LLTHIATFSLTQKSEIWFLNVIVGAVLVALAVLFNLFASSVWNVTTLYVQLCYAESGKRDPAIRSTTLGLLKSGINRSQIEAFTVP
jgi:hypothetical protein